MKKIFIIDNYPLTLKGIALILEAEPDLEVCGQARTGKSALAEIETLNPDLVIVELAVAGMGGLDLIKHLRTRKPGMPLLVLSRFPEMKYAGLALKAGAMGYVMKKAPIEDFMAAVRRVLAGEVYVSEVVNRQLLHEIMIDGDLLTHAPSEVLSGREWEVFKMFGHGLSTREIADSLGLSIKTVDSYRARIKQKLQLRSGSEMIRLALQWVAFESA